MRLTWTGTRTTTSAKNHHDSPIHQFVAQGRKIDGEREGRPTIDFDKAGIITKTVHEHVEYPNYHTVRQIPFAGVRTYYIVRPILHIMEKHYHQL